MLDPGLLATRANRIRLAAFDVDGVLTDGRIILGAAGEEFKAFHVRDGHGLVSLRQHGVTVAIITGRSSPVVDRRMAELGIKLVRQGVTDKWAELAGLLQAQALDPAAVCYVGDDLPDLEPMRRVGLPIAVADAVAEIRQVAVAVTANAGGRGAVREVCDLIVGATQRPCA